MEVKTYTKRTNARRAARAEGVPVEAIEITVYKNAQGVRFGWKRLTGDSGRQALTKAAPSTLVLARFKKPPLPPAAAPQHAVRNGVKRPAQGGLCAQVWEWLDVHPTAAVREVKVEADARAWNVGNATCEYYAWRRFNGLSGKTFRPNTS
ncbi:MAG: hypothetical protein K5880_11775 [Hydrogenophaga sp.]|uniref:hypothetical protein n=1 Tax=Hydrogenophaga sp. TaxID=1904254 RepID=UPI002614C3C8|nr:hypothetical protein [Hydrogenophaga sp.]MCV0439304.1 hypothetical protein [Hydrogenophaga sp.]